MTYEEAYKVLMAQISIDVSRTTDIDRDAECLRKCAEALEKQIPKKATRVATIVDWQFFDCPVCGANVGYKGGERKHLFKFCHGCGQAIEAEK